MTTPRATVVVPVFNEAARIDLPAFARFLDSTVGFDLLFVDDGSTDQSPARLAEFAAAHAARSAVLALPRNVGKAEAVRRGVVEAFGRAPAPVAVGYLDADLAAPLEAIGELATELERHPDAWAIIGSRVRLLGRRIHRSALRHYLGRVFATAASLALALPVYDTQCGCKLFRNRPEVRDAFAEPFHSRWIFDVELLARLADAPGPEPLTRFREVPLERWHGEGGSRLTLGAWFRAPFELLAIRRRHGGGSDG